MFDIAHALNELKGGRSLIFSPKRGVLRITGTDARDFLQRMSTNNLMALSHKNPVQSSFTNNKGRMIDHCLLFLNDHNDVILVSSHEKAEILRAWLEQFHFVEDFSLTDITKECSFRFVIMSSSKPNPDDVKFAVKCWQAELTEVLSLDFFGMLDGASLDDGLIIDKGIWQTIRIAALMPASPNEINDRWMPQNINLGDFIAEDKGCYTGQEVIAKARTYQKNIKTLCGALVSPSDLARIKPGFHVESVDGQFGEITSVAPLSMKGLANILLMADLNRKSGGIEPHEKVKSLRPFLIKNTNKFH